MRIAIYHNLAPGGAMHVVENIAKQLLANNHTIDMYSLNNYAKLSGINEYNINILESTTNIFEHLTQAIIKIPKINKIFADKINNIPYDAILIFPCLVCQSPPILKYLKNKSNVIYLYSESKREFYENTSFDYYHPKKLLTRFIRLPIKYLDKINCQYAKKIVVNSIYSSYILKKIYNKTGFVIYPGMINTKPNKLSILNKRKLISVGQLSKIKGHDFSIKQIYQIINKFTVIGRKTNEYPTIVKISKKYNIKLKTYVNIPDNQKKIICKKYSIYLANMQKEPFGIATLEATQINLPVLGINMAGTSEIIQHGLNGWLYPNDNVIAKQILIKILKQSTITIYGSTIIDWRATSNKLEKVINHPNE